VSGDHVIRRLAGDARRLLAHPRAPIVALILIVLYSLGARVLYLGEPCSTPCTGATAHTLIFDEAYYVDAARVIDRIRPPAGLQYHDAPLGKDPNAEHPQLAKLAIAAGIELFGDGPAGWRFGSVLFGLIAIVAMYALVRAARGSPWLAVGACAVMALDNLMLVHGRIATLDVYVVASMLVAVTLYLRGAAVLAGVAVGLAACMKEVGLYVLPVLVLLEVIRICWARGAAGGIDAALRARVRPLAIAAGTGLLTLVLVLWLLDVLVPAYDPGTHATYGGSPFSHIGHILSYGFQLKAIPNATGISSMPLQWLLDQKPIDYARVAVNSITGGQVVASRALVLFRGEVNPFIIFLAIPALFAAAAAAWRERDDVAALGAAWCVGTFLPFVVQAYALGRISYLYYILIVMPGVYLTTARLFSRSQMPTAATIGWAVALIYGFIELYPVRSLPLH
jgi:4-amino-4-deoxy-L-arabinose transferase-like glycosyltransferase